MLENKLYLLQDSLHSVILKSGPLFIPNPDDCS